MSASVLFVQNRTHRAGAQTALLRLLRFRAGQGARDALVCSDGGWLAGQARDAGVRVFVEQFPKSRTLGALLLSNRSFARRVASAVSTAGVKPDIVQANDHTEGLLGRAIAQELGAPAAIFLRSSGMTKRDYSRYRCERFNLAFAVGEELCERIKAWDPSQKVELIFDGIGEDEFLEPKRKRASAPTRVLVIGTAGEAKGWGDLAAAIKILLAGGMTSPAFDFTSDTPEARAWFSAPEIANVHCNFLGRVEAFRDLVRGYDLVLNPSRNESFGMAAIEVLAAGVPLLSSRTGVIEQVQPNPEMLFPPRNPKALAHALANVLSRWNEIDFGVQEAQSRIRERFLIDRAAAKVDAAYRDLLAQK